MISKISATALIASVSAAATELPSNCRGLGFESKCDDFPLYKMNSGLNEKSLSEFPYACLRNNYAYVWPKTKSGSSVINGG